MPFDSEEGDAEEADREEHTDHAARPQKSLAMRRKGALKLSPLQKGNFPSGSRMGISPLNSAQSPLRGRDPTSLSRGGGGASRGLQSPPHRKENPPSHSGSNTPSSRSIRAGGESPLTPALRRRPKLVIPLYQVTSPVRRNDQSNADSASPAVRTMGESRRASPRMRVKGGTSPARTHLDEDDWARRQSKGDLPPNGESPSQDASHSRSPPLPPHLNPALKKGSKSPQTPKGGSLPQHWVYSPKRIASTYSNSDGESPFRNALSCVIGEYSELSSVARGLQSLSVHRQATQELINAAFIEVVDVLASVPSENK